MSDYFSHVFSSFFPILSPCLFFAVILFLCLSFSLHPSTPSLPLSVAPQQDTSIVWVTVPTPSVLSECVQARERDPSTEPALVREAVLERASRVMLAEGTERKGREEVENGGKKETINEHYIYKTKKWD